MSGKKGKRGLVAAAAPVVEDVKKAEPVDDVVAETKDAPTAASVVVAEEQLPNPNFRFEILSAIKTAQIQNGVRATTHDYKRYRQYATRRIRRVAKSVGFLHGKNVYKSRVMEPKNVVEPRWLSIPLFCAERAWSYGMELKHELKEGDHPRYRFRLIKRFAKAAKFAASLKELCAARADTHTQLEAEAYCAWLDAGYALERDRLADALRHYTKAKAVLGQLAKLGNADNENLCDERIAAIEPIIRFCQYSIDRKEGKKTAAGASGSVDDLSQLDGVDDLLKTKLDEVLGEARKKQAQTINTVTWQGRAIPVRSEKLRVCFLEAKEKSNQLASLADEKKELKGDKKTAAAAAADPTSPKSTKKSLAATATATASGDGDDDHDDGTSTTSDRKRMVLYGDAFALYENALKQIRDELKDLAAIKQTAGKGEEARANLAALQSYASSNKLELAVERNLLLVESLRTKIRDQDAGERRGKKLSKPDEVVMLYDKIIQNINELIEVNGGAVVNPTLTKSLENRIAISRAYKTFYLADAYRRVSKSTEAVALYGRARESADKAIAIIGTSLPADVAALRTMSQEALSQQSQVHAAALLSSVTSSSSSTSGGVAGEAKVGAPRERLLVDRLDEFDAGNAASNYNLVSFPPNFEATPSKPILFDLAHNFIGFNVASLDKKVKEKPAEKKGFFGRLWSLGK